jgi:hypothetical protein
MLNQTTITNDTPTTPAPVCFQLGQIYLTPGAQDALEESGESAQTFINSHARLEQGELSNEDHRENLFSVSRQLRIFSAFKTANNVKIWVITEADRSVTTILLPSEY